MASAKLRSFLSPMHRSSIQLFSALNLSSSAELKESVRAAVESKRYEQIPELLAAAEQSLQNHNPFSFLSAFPENVRISVVDDILQSFIPLRPRSRPFKAYSCLLSYTLQSSNPLPIALAVLQRILRSGCLPTPQTHLLLSNAWIKRRKQLLSVSDLLSEMKSIGYSPDSGTCNYLISSLCKVDQLREAVSVLKGMGRGGCVPDLDSYGSLIAELCELRMIDAAVEMVREMVVRVGLNPRQDVLVKVLGAMRANKEIWRAVKMVEMLEAEGVHLGFECFELVLEGCIECRQFVLAGKFVMNMTKKGFIPYIRVRQRLVEGLAEVGEWELGNAVRQRFAELNSYLRSSGLGVLIGHELFCIGKSG
nr:pentatricopeptide repeat-containing protein At1g06270 [Ipomoea batatas]